MKKAVRKMVVKLVAFVKAIIDEETETMFLFYNHRWA